MASIIRSARDAGADIFGAIGTTARMAGKTVNSASHAVDTLELKSKELYDTTADAVASRRPTARQRCIIDAADEHTEFLRSSWKRRNPGLTDSDFPWAQIWDQVYSSIEDSVVNGGQAPSLTLQDIFPDAAPKTPKLRTA
jgi:hypothetical protein